MSAWKHHNISVEEPMQSPIEEELVMVTTVGLYGLNETCLNIDVNWSVVHRYKQLEELTLRDQFAMAALTGLVTSQVHAHNEDLAISSYRLADQMMKERKNEKL